MIKQTKTNGGATTSQLPPGGQNTLAESIIAFSLELPSAELFRQGRTTAEQFRAGVADFLESHPGRLPEVRDLLLAHPDSSVATNALHGIAKWKPQVAISEAQKLVRKASPSSMGAFVVLDELSPHAAIETLDQMAEPTNPQHVRDNASFLRTFSSLVPID